MVAVSLPRRRQQKFVCMAQRLGKNRHRPGLDAAAVGPVHHFVEVAQEAEPRHIRAGVNLVGPAALGGIFIQGGHGGDGGLHSLGTGLAHTVRGAENAHAQPLGQHQAVTCLGRVVGVNMVRVDNAHNRQAVFHIAIGDGVAPGQHAAGLRHLFRAAAHHLPQNIQVRLLREAHNVQRRFHLAAHGPYIAEGVGGCNLPEGVGVVHHRREKVQGLHHRHLVRQLIHGGVILAVVADEQRRVLVKLRQPFQHPAQNAGAQLGGAAAALTKQFFVTHKAPPYSAA